MSTPEPCSRYEHSREKALELFATKGFGQVSMRELATHVGLTAGSLYHHFPSKQHLLFDLIEEFYEDLLTTFPPAARRRSTNKDWLAPLIEAHLRLYRNKPMHYHVAQRDTCCLTQNQQQRISDLRHCYEQKLRSLITLDTSVPKKIDAIGHMMATLLKSIPDWLERRSLEDIELAAVIKSQILHTVHCLTQVSE